MSSAQQDHQALPRVAVLGIGTMGRGMAHSLLRAGFTVDAWNRTPEPAAQLAADGATAHDDPAQAVEHADVVITMVPDARAVDGVAFGQGMLAALRPGAVWAQMGTIGVAATDDLNTRVSKERPDVSFVDAPVSGTKAPAETGTCSSWRPGRRRRGRGWTRCSPSSASAPSGWAPPDRPLPLVEAVRDRWAELDEAGLGGLDVAAARHGLDKPDATAR